MKNSAFQRGFERGQSDAFDYKKKDPNKGLSFFQKLSFGVSRDSQDYIVGYNKGYFKVLKERKEEKELREAERGFGNEAVTDDSHLQTDGAASRKELLQKLKEVEQLKKKLEKDGGDKDLEL